MKFWQRKLDYVTLDSRALAVSVENVWHFETIARSAIFNNNHVCFPVDFQNEGLEPRVGDTKAGIPGLLE